MCIRDSIYTASTWVTSPCCNYGYTTITFMACSNYCKVHRSRRIDSEPHDTRTCSYGLRGKVATMSWANDKLHWHCLLSFLSMVVGDGIPSPQLVTKCDNWRRESWSYSLVWRVGRISGRQELFHVTSQWAWSMKNKLEINWPPCKYQIANKKLNKLIFSKELYCCNSCTPAIHFYDKSAYVVAKF